MADTEEAVGGDMAAGDRDDAADDEDVGGEAKETKDPKKKKKDKKKDKVKEKKPTKEDAQKDKDKKKKAHIDKIKEQIRKQLEEKEKVLKVQEEEEKRLQKLEEERLEKLMREQEKKEKEKQKRKDRIARQKAEGTYLTAEQKAKRIMERQKIEQMKSQGLVVTATGERPKKPKYIDKRKLRNNQVQTEQQQQQPEEVLMDEAKTKEDGAESLEEKRQESGNAEAREAWDVEDSAEEEGSEPESQSDSTKESSSGAEESESGSEAPQVKQEAEPIIVRAETKEQKREMVVERIKKRKEDAETRRSLDELRSPVVCVLGHVDTGKTKILDKIRRTHVQDGEAGGITQQIGATMVPADAIREQGKMAKIAKAEPLKIPGFLIIDTPGHESFSNLRSRGSSLCDVAILVVDVMHGLEPQTIESIRLLTKRKTPFVIALNKIDRLYDWKPNPGKDIRSVIQSQAQNCRLEFDERQRAVVTQFAEQGLNVALYWENPDQKDYHSMIPTSAHSGDGMGNLMMYLAQFCQKFLSERLAFSEELQCTVLEVKQLPGLGTTIDVILVNGTLHYGDTIVVAGAEGPIVTTIRELMMPQPLKELRVKNPYEHFKEVRGAQGVKIQAKELEKALAGLSLLVAQKEDELEILREEMSEALSTALQSIRLSERGVHVQASTLGSLEALLIFLRSQKIPYSGINIGPVHKKDVMKASTMLEHDSQWAVVLAFDVKIERDAQLHADELGVKIFHADIIYHLQDAFVKYRDDLREKKRQERAHLAIFPAKFRVMQQCVFNSRSPIIVGVAVEAGVLRVGTPVCVPSKENLLLGTVSSLEINNKAIESARQGQEVCVKIENTTGDAPKMYGRHFDHEDVLVSRISRESIDVCKEFFREDLTKGDWQLIVELKKILGIL